MVEQASGAIDSERVYEQLRNTLRKLPTTPERETHVDHLAQMLLSVHQAGPRRVPKHLLSVGPAKARQQLDRLARAAERLAKCASSLSEPSFIALVTAGFRGEVLASDALAIADAARVAETLIDDGLKEVGGRPLDHRAQVAASMAAYAFKRLTGESMVPQSSTKRVLSRNQEVDHYPVYGRFLKLVTAIFETLQIDASAEHYADRAAGLANMPIKDQPG